MSRSRAVREARAGLFSSQLSMQLDDDGKLMIKAGHLFKRELRKVLNEIEDDARKIVRRRHSKPDRDKTKRTGRLRRSIHAGQVRRAGPHRLQGTVSAGSRLAPYAWYVHEGTKPGVRTVKNPKAHFRFLWTGRTGKVRQFYPGEGVDEAYLKATGNLRIVPLVYKRGPRKGLQKTYSELVDGDLNNKDVRVKSINHPGYRGDRFLNNAAVGVIRRYGGTLRRRDGSIIPPS